MRYQCLLKRRSRVHRPRSPIRHFCSATASMRITVPQGWTCVASGQPVPMSSAVSLKDILRDGKLFEFKASEPLRYLALVVARFTRVSEVDPVSYTHLR